MRTRPDVRWWLISLAVHAVMLLVLAVAVRNPGLLPWATVDRPGRADTVTIIWSEPDEGLARTAVGGGAGPVAIGPLAPVGGPAGVPLRDTAFAGIDLGLPEGDGVPPVSPTPGFGDGRLWVRPGAVIARGADGAGEAVTGGVSAPLDVATHIARIDSVLARRIVAYLDTLAPDSFAYELRPPAWTTEIDGRTWGIDQQWIYLGDLKLPTALLGLLPLGIQGNYEQGQRAADLQRIREDILRAAARASDAADFRRYVNELRERREAERRQNRQNPQDP